MPRLFTCTLFALLVSQASTARAERLTLDGFVTQVQQANPTIQSATARAEALRLRISPARSWDDPFFAVGPDDVPTDGSGGMVRYQLGQTIPFPGRLGARGEAAENQARRAGADAATTRRELKVLATQLYWRAIYSDELIRTNSRIRALVRESVASARSRYRTGGAEHHEWLLAKIELSVLDVEKSRLERDRQNILAAMNELRAQSPEQAIELADAEFSRGLPEPPTLEEILANQPELESALAGVSASEAALRSAKLAYFPDLVLQGMLMQPSGMAGMEASTQWGLMIGVSVPLFFFSKQSKLVSAARFDVEAAVAGKAALDNRLRVELAEARRHLKTARDIVSLYQKDVIPLTEMALKNAQSGYSARRLPLSQLLETARVQRAQSLEYFAARVDVELARVRVMEPLASPPVLRLAPARPSVFGGAGMGGMTGASAMGGDSGMVNMGGGLKPPAEMPSAPEGESGGMGGMEGM